MAKKARRKSAVKRKKKSRAVSKKKRKPVMKAKKSRKSRPKSFAGKIAGGYRVVVDTVKGTDRLRNRLEPPATSETE